MERRRFLQSAAALSALGVAGCHPFSPAPTGESRTYGGHVLDRVEPNPHAPNVLFISLDDQNDWLGYLNPHPGTSTPNADALSTSSVLYRNAYCAAPICLASRTSTLWGMHPHESGVYDHTAASKAIYNGSVVPGMPSIIDDFWAAGYNTYGAGKVFGSGAKDRFTEYRRTLFYADPNARDHPAWAGRFDPNWLSPYDGQPIGDGQGWPKPGIDFGPSGLTAEEDPDGQASLWAKQVLARNHTRPFFLALGIVLPHTPWRIPQEFLDLHPLESVQPPAYLPTDLDDLPPYAVDQIIDQAGAFEFIHGQGAWAAAVQAYQASTSYCDWMLGVVLDELENGPYADNTIVVLWSDHGFHLGEKLHFHKFTLWDASTRVPLLIRFPGQTESIEVSEPVSLLDVGPTLAAAAEVPLSLPWSGGDLVQRSLSPELFDANPPVTTWMAGNHAVRWREWRYIRYSTGDTELYDRSTDPGEWTNLAGDPEHAELVQMLDAMLPPPSAAGAESGGSGSGSVPDESMYDDPWLGDPWFEE